MNRCAVCFEETLRPTTCSSRCAGVLGGRAPRKPRSKKLSPEHPCDVCGTATRNPKCCSRKCATIQGNRTDRKRGPRGVARLCCVCGDEILPKRKAKYCTKCRDEIKDSQTLEVRMATYGSNPPSKAHLYGAGLKTPRCEWCGISKWRGKPAPLQLDHIDGDVKNNRIENLRILCANCHAQTPTWCKRKTSRRSSKEEHLGPNEMVGGSSPLVGTQELLPVV